MNTPDKAGGSFLSPDTPVPDIYPETERDPNAPDHITRSDINEALDCMNAVADAADAITALATAFAAQLMGRAHSTATVIPPQGPRRR